MRVHQPAAAEAAIEVLRERSARDGRVELLGALDDEGGNTFFSCLFGNSPYLTRLILRDTEFAEALALQHPDTLAAGVTAGLSEADAAMNRDRLMRLLRKQRSRVTILAAVLDCFGIRDVMACAGMLASMADQAVRLAAEHLLLDRVARGELGQPEGDADARRWGYFVLAAGRHGARELGYSSDVSLMALYDPESIRYTGSRSLQDCFVRVTRDLARILQARTRDGYVFRTDLRLRPDASSSPPAVSEEFALRYYRNSGRTWERAVLVTARPVAGDQTAAADFLKRLDPFIWEEGLNFASVEDIRSMKRQIHDFHHRRRTLRGRGLDLELGRGGIREAEFFVLMHQLAYGGRSRRLRGSGVVPMLKTLEREGHLLPREAWDLRDAYLQLHRIEHRVQLVNDEPTRALPASGRGLDNVACLLGVESGAEVTRMAERAMDQVHALFRTRFTVPESERDLATDVLDGPAGEAADVLLAEGFRQPDEALDIFRGWAAGRHASTSPARARSAIRAVMLELVGALTRTPDPDLALARVDRLFRALPSDTSLYAMLRANTWLLNLVAVVMGSAPRLAEALECSPRILEAVLDPSFFLPIPEAAELGRELGERLHDVDDPGRQAAVVAEWTEERRFQVGVQTLENLVEADEASLALSHVADAAIAAFLRIAIAASEEQWGRTERGGCAVVALGELGATEMTTDSDLEYLLVADTPTEASPASPPDPDEAQHFFADVACRLTDALRHPSAGGPLYGIKVWQHGPGGLGEVSLTTVESLRSFYSGSASTLAELALTRARVTCGDPGTMRMVEAEIRGVLARHREPGPLAAEVVRIRAQIDEHRGNDPFALRYSRGGLLDLELLAQYLVLLYSHRSATPIAGATVTCFEALGVTRLVPVEEVRVLLSATRMQRTIGAMLRLTSGGDITVQEAPEALKRRLVRALDCGSFEELAAKLEDARRRVFGIFQNRMGSIAQ